MTQRNPEIRNASQLPRVYYARHMLPGVVGYDKETILVDADTMKRMIPSFDGKPVYVGHQEVDVEKLENEADGYVADCFYNQLDGWLWAKIIVTSDRGHDAVSKGWSVSNAYVPVEWGGSGKHLNMDYSRNITNAEFTHLAIVPNPRYENACIMTQSAFKEYQAKQQSSLDELHNSKETQTGVMRMLNIFKRKKVEVQNGDDLSDAMIEVKNDDGTVEEVCVGDLIKAEKARKEAEKQNAKKNAEDDEKKKDEDKEKMNMDSEVDVDGETMTLGELVNKYKNSKKNAKKNADDEDDKKKDGDKKDDEDDKKNKKNEKKNDLEGGSHAEELLNANKNFAPAPAVVETSMDQLARGQKNYGSGK